jgi:hypothetical protein
MATEASKTKVEEQVTETVEKMGKTVENVLDRIVENQTRLAEAAASARDRSRRVSDEYVKSLATAQSDASKLAKQMAGSPTAYNSNIQALVESTTAAQTRAMEMTKLFYREQAEATAEFQQLVAPLFESNKGFEMLSKNFRSFLDKTAESQGNVCKHRLEHQVSGATQVMQEGIETYERQCETNGRL